MVFFLEECECLDTVLQIRPAVLRRAFAFLLEPIFPERAEAGQASEDYRDLNFDEILKGWDFFFFVFFFYINFFTFFYISSYMWRLSDVLCVGLCVGAFG